MFRMPVSGIEVELRQPTGAEDALLLEARGEAVSTSVALLERLVMPSSGGRLDAGRLSITDLEALLLELRRRLFGDVISSRGRCSDEGCAAPIDLSFRIGEYLNHRGSRRPANVTVLEQEPDWFELRDREARFRLVTAHDLLAAKRSRSPQRELALRTIRCPTPQLLAGVRRRVQRAMESLAPPLSGEIAGRCPACGTTISAWFDVQSYVQRELRYDAEFLYEDVHQLASRYHWDETTILSLPRMRRVQYVDRVLRAGGGY